MTTDKGLITAYVLDGKGGGRRVDWDEINDWDPSKGMLWVHLDYSSRQAKQWLRKESGLDQLTVKALTMDDVRPRSAVYKDSILLSLRGVNLNPGHDPEDMVSIRIWFDNHRVITTRRRMLLSINDLSLSIDKGRGPSTTAELIVMLNNHIINRMADVIDDIMDQVDDLESEVMIIHTSELRPQISEVRRQALLIRRYLFPQREALYQLQVDRSPLFSDQDVLQLREGMDRMMRYIEDLDTARERASITQEELASRLSEQMNSRMYLLSIVAVLFLPLTFITGLLGVNVAGIPGSDHPLAFIIVCIIMVAIFAVTLWILRRKHWM